MVIDVHVHVYPGIHGLIGAGPVWGIGYGLASVGGEKTPVLPPLNENVVHTPEMLVAHMDLAGVDRAVLLQGSFYGECNDYVRDAVRQYPNRLAGAAYVDPWADGAQREFERVFGNPGFCALKLECSEATGFTGIHPDARLDALENVWLWRELEARGLTLVLDLGDAGTRGYQTDGVRAIAERHPDLKIVIAHLAQPRPEIESNPTYRKLWEKQIDLGLLPNVWFDTASLPTYAPEDDFPYPTSGRYLGMAIDRIGADKIMWGTDVPGLLVHCTYSQLKRMTLLHSASLSPHEQALVMGETAESVFDWSW